MVDYAQALQRLLDAASPLPAQRVSVAQAHRAVLAEDVVSPQCLPPFDNAAMDGFALHAGGHEIPAGSEFPVQGRLAAGEVATLTGSAQGAWEIMTGAGLPPGLDSVVPFEQVDVDATADGGRRIRLRQSLQAGRHVRLRGQDMATGARVLAAGSCLGLHEQVLLRTLGVDEVTVRVAPRVGVIATGSELVADATQPLRPAQIRDSNRPYLVARLHAAGAQVAWQGLVGDDPPAFHAALDEATAAGCGLVVSTGAVSQGCHDFVPDALRARGAEIVFHQVAMRPGKPLLFARLPDGILYLGLPGNPVSAAAGQRFFVEPLLRRQLGLAEEQPLWLPLRGELDKRPGLRLHALGRVGLDAQFRLGVRVLPRQESFRLTTMCQANAWVVPEADADRVAPGALVQVYGWGHLDPLQLTAGDRDDAD